MTNADSKDHAEGTVFVPGYALRALEVLETAGFEAWFVGGFVRDSILGRPINDIDMASNASWQETEKAFEDAGFQTHETGIKHGTLTVVVDDNAIEITTFRTDGDYLDGRHPENVSFVKSIEEDLARRDFTMNAIAYHPQRGFCDPYGGRADIEARLIRTVGNPFKRFKEDYLRALRACRFCSELGFEIDEDALKVMTRGKTYLLDIPAERVTYELQRFLMGEYVHDALLKSVNILAGIMPELIAMKDFDQRTPYHIYTVLEHTAYVIQNSPHDPIVRWAALFHDVGKPAAFFSTNGIGHFFGHGRISMLIADQIMSRLSISPSNKKKILTLVEMHDDKIEPSSRGVRRCLKRLDGDVELFRMICAIKRADAMSQTPHFGSHRVEIANNLEAELDSVLANGEPFAVKQLAINGNDVLSLGVEPGPVIGQVLEDVLNAVIDGCIPNDRERLLAYAAADVS